MANQRQFLLQIMGNSGHFLSQIMGNQGQNLLQIMGKRGQNLSQIMGNKWQQTLETKSALRRFMPKDKAKRTSSKGTIIVKNEQARRRERQTTAHHHHTTLLCHEPTWKYTLEWMNKKTDGKRSRITKLQYLCKTNCCTPSPAQAHKKHGGAAVHARNRFAERRD